MRQLGGPQASCRASGAADRGSEAVEGASKAADRITKGFRDSCEGFGETKWKQDKEKTPQGGSIVHRPLWEKKRLHKHIRVRQNDKTSIKGGSLDTLPIILCVSDAPQHH